ncbi:MAG: ABC transporter permease [Candidatus Hydrogenedentota bacterium]|nr:MAG: ABC transporter permease [Candidatus Hydrogenedentota bacterium]
MPLESGLGFERPAEDTLLIRFAGSWKLGAGLRSAAEAQRQIESDPRLRRISFETAELTGWDTGFLTFLRNVSDICSRSGVEVDMEGLPQGARRLLALAAAVPEEKGGRKEASRKSVFYRTGVKSLDLVRSSGEMVGFVGESFLAFLQLVRGKARFRRTDLSMTVQECGAQALPIVTLVSVLVGMILAFIGAVQLRKFGAEIYVASLVGIGMARELAPLMTAIIMAGRTGAAFAAQLGTMQVNEEIDALKTLGFPPMEFLVLPRMFALLLMMPLLCIYSDLMGVVGGGVIGVGMLDLNIMQYYETTRISVGLMDFSQGILKSAVFGVIVAISGCLRGIQCGRSASAVGAATTSAVVTGIILIIAADAIIDVVFQLVGI